MNTKTTHKIKLWGIVQGVGFRPFVAKLADRFNMRGEVLNIGGLVVIVVTDEVLRIDEFLLALQEEKPVPAEIVHIKREVIAYRAFDEFRIIDSHEGDDEAAMIPADLAICPDCLSEMRDEGNRRYGHPFISCMICGPRYTIIDRIPYDRENTSMIDFELCTLCAGEYTDRKDRRYHAQTVSCHDCGPMLEGSLESAVSLINAGKVIAVKGMGGYNLICDPASAGAVSTLRQIKGREQKPFAIMFKDVNQIRNFCDVSDIEEKLLLSSARPILLLERKTPAKTEVAEFEKSRFVGAFLPSMGLQYLLLDACGRPLIVTSANPSSMPIIKDEAEMFAFVQNTGGLIAGVFYNERKIRIGVDDSVARVIDGQPQMIRRSKGYAPVPLYVSIEDGPLPKEAMILACGGQLKNAFALSKGPFSYISQYFGDLDSIENQRIYEENIERMKGLFRIQPKLVVCDSHPLYESTKFAEEYAGENNVPCIKVQHHHAHVASVMAEHQLGGPVIGVSFDGTGYGTDGAIWGGEFLVCERGGFSRAAHLKYVEMLGGDSSMKEAWKSAMSYVYAHEQGYLEENAERITIDLTEMIEYSKIKQNPNWPIVCAALEHRVNTIKSSSMGRLFDAVSALLDIKQENDYEGQCAIMLEDAAARALKNPGADRRDDLALQFHRQIANMILKQCIIIRNDENVNQVALTGGVFQNKILMEESLALLRGAGFFVYYNISVSPNDGGIALGQNYIGMQYI